MNELKVALCFLDHENKPIVIKPLESNWSVELNHDIRITERSYRDKIRDEMTEICESGLFPISIVTQDGSRVRITMQDTSISLLRNGEEKETKVWLMVGGIRKGMQQLFRRKTEEEYIANARFWASAGKTAP